MKFLSTSLIAAVLSISFVMCDNDRWEWTGPETENIENTNAEIPLEFNNYLGNSENIHPKVLYFRNGWNGYRFWMAYTPYPSGSTVDENPCIAASHDGKEWETPTGLVNPLSPAPVNGYNSDTHLVYNKSSDTLECWWREFDKTTQSDAICRKISKDGIYWGEKETVMPFDKSKGMRLSPAVQLENGEYVMVYCDMRELQVVRCKGTEDNWTWSAPEPIYIDWGELRPWHQDMITTRDGRHELVVCAYGPEGSNNEADLYYVSTDSDFTGATAPVLILRRGWSRYDFDQRSIYRSSIVMVDNYYYLYYSSIDKQWHRHMGLAIGKDIMHLTGIGKD